MQMSIDEIIVRKRLRRDLGDLDELAESLQKHGLLNPIIVNNKKVLLAGERRLESAKLLGWKTIPVRILDNPSTIQSLEIEIEENMHRKAFTPDETIDAFDKLEKLRNPGFFRRFLNAIKSFFIKIVSIFKRLES
ncbi:MAG: ParB N-terminal domain-containing protein [Spirochaetales bacterium]|uniref:ParB N-terminal domain-containing protein n=1 Tax=Candidatus Thalassospirochaeta sargassi TaxID=3119039 RepID=A0AAJ1IF60_9SPIO|nr:ParB N-terminal domain-containing protein [Spirochaetales bacterium]